jgi:hypothetical protein
MNGSPTGLEFVTRVTPLGLRFWDAVTGAVVADGLAVTAYPPGGGRRVSAYTTRSGVFVLQGLPGLRDLEEGEGDAAYWDFLPPGRRFVLEVVDREGRFQPFTFTADLPARGLLTWRCEKASPPESAAAFVPLFSTAARTVPAGTAVLRADLWDPWAQVPAAWAVLEVRAPGRPPVRGIADGRGRVAVLFPYPEPTSPFPDLGSPPAGAAAPFTAQEWPLEVRAAYAPQDPAPAIPDLCDTLGQPPADLWADSFQIEPLTGAVLKLGQELIVRTRDAGRLTPLPVLYITPAASPP